MTKAHRDRIEKQGSDKGYSIRVGKTLPLNSANLAYVRTPGLDPEANLQINDLSMNIKENGLPDVYQSEKLVYPGEDFLLREIDGESKLPSKRITLTDEFSLPVNTQDEPKPLYYRAAVKGLFDAKGALVSPYLGGYSALPPEEVVDYARVDAEERENLLYLGTKIKVTNLDGTDVRTDYKYKIHLVREEGESIPQNAYSIYLYTNFRGNSNETFTVRYEKYNEDGSHTSDYTEVLNAYPFFEQTEKAFMDELAENPTVNGDWREELNLREYSIVETEDNAYQVYAPSQVLIANNVTRPSHQFKYRVRGNLKARLSSSNAGAIKIGIAYVNSSVPNVEDLTGTIQKLYGDPNRPAYLEFVNPYPPQKSFTKDNPRYWLMDLRMPAEQWNEYDLVIITGYGFKDMSPYSDAIRNYLENGGKLWVDNAGEGSKALNFVTQDGKQTFLSTVGFSPTATSTGFKAPSANEEAVAILSRYNMLSTQEQLDLGYNVNNVAVNNAFVFGSGETDTTWTGIARYSNNDLSVMKKTMFGKGTVYLSNCGIFRAIFHGKETDIKLVMNIFLTAAEEKWVHGPWNQEYVYHRDNLFREEYKGAGGNTLYVDERADTDATQIVAKKILRATTREALLAHLPSSHFSAKGVYEVEVQSNTIVPVQNGSVEVGTYDNALGRATTQWTATTPEAIPGWNIVHLAGATPQFSHISSNSQRGSKAIELTVEAGIGTHAFWSNYSPRLVAGSYRATIWMKTENVSAVSTQGASMAIYNLDGEKIAQGTPILGSRDWLKIDVDFALSSTQTIDVRVGFVDGNGTGTITVDYLTLSSIGSVMMTPSNDGSRKLYAYAVRPRGEVFDLRAQGFTSADITTYDPEIEVTYSIRSFVYAWDNYAGRYMRKYGNAVTGRQKIRRSDGIVSFGSLSTMLPPLNAGADWADRNDVYYEVYLGGNTGIDADSNYVSLEIYNAQEGRYYFNKNGEVVIKYMDLFYGGENRNILLQAHTNYYTIRATKRRYGLMVHPENKIQLAYPSTIDNRDCWFLRIQNGSFIKKELNYEDIKTLLGTDGRFYEFQQRIFGTHFYSLPEYSRQVFKPSMGIKRIRMETAEYINDFTVKVQDAPLHVKRGSVRKELLPKIDTKGLVYGAINGEWSKSVRPKVYVDENMNGIEVEWVDGFDIDYANGLVIFEEPVNGTVKVDYDYDNLTVWKRTYNNMRIREEELITQDRKSFVSKNTNWLPFPQPIIKIRPYGVGAEKIVPVTSYTIDYQSGMVIFKEEIKDRVFAEYTHSNDKKLVIRDFDAQNGFIYLEDEIDFKNEIYVDYYYEENFLEYRGYYDEAVGRFIHLDLNPSEGHYSTMPVVRTDGGTGQTFTSWESVPTAKLMNKEIYVYILPYKDSFGNYNEHTVRHCYSITEWQSVQKTNPTAMILGVIHLREHTNVNEAVVMDARTRGGGLKESITKAEIKKTQPLSENYWDMNTWDGTAYYKNGVVIIEVPKIVLASEGGRFTEEQVRNVVGKYIAYGTYFIVEYI